MGMLSNLFKRRSTSNSSSVPGYKRNTATLEACDHMDGHEFEHFCAKLLTENGYQNVSVTPGSGDQGIDVLAQKDGVKYAIQCKCYSSDIGNKAIQEAYAGKTFYDCHVGVVLTNRYFTAAARELASKNGILLWDRNKLASLINGSRSGQLTFVDHVLDETNQEEAQKRALKYTELYKKVGLYAIEHDTYNARIIATALGEDLKSVNACLEGMILNGVITTETFNTLGKFSIVMNKHQFLASLKK